MTEEAMTDEHLLQIRERHRIADSEETWMGSDDTESVVYAFEDRADLLDEVERLRGNEALYLPRARNVLRDRFAASALTGLLASGRNMRVEFLAEEAYGYADRMLTERAKTASAPPDSPVADDVGLDKVRGALFGRAAEPKDKPAATGPKGVT